REATVAPLGTRLHLSGSASLPLAKTSTPHMTPYGRIARGPGGRGAAATDSTWPTEEAPGNADDGLDNTPAAALSTRTRAQIQIADKADQKLRAPNFTEVVAGSPSFTDYPMWFYAFGTADEKSTDGDEQLTQVMLVTRESASAEPLVRSSSYIPTDQMPTLMADDAGAVEPGPDDFD